MRAGLPLLLLALAVQPARAGELLPVSVGDWSSTLNTQLRPEALEQVSGEDAAVLREYGTLGAERSVYEMPGHKLTVTLYRMRDSTAAYGAYTFLRSADMAASDLAEKSAVGRDRVLVVLGNLLLDVSGASAAHLADLKSLVAKIALRAERAPYPTLWEFLPGQGLMPNSDHYILGPLALARLFPISRESGSLDWVGFSQGAEAEVARYQLRGKSVPLLLIIYPTPQLAMKKLEELGTLFTVNPEGDSDGAESGNRPTFFVERKGTLLAIVAETHSKLLAQGLLSRVQHETSLTWNEAGWKAKEPPFAEMLLAVFVGTGLLLLYGMVSSLAFGFFRLGIKRVLPGKVFDRPEQLEILQLGISSKPIESKDFYTEVK